MHERTQRAIARLMFVFCCAVPTAITMLCVLVTWTPWYHNRCLQTLEATLSHDTGLVITIDDFERTSPSSLRLHSVRAIEPETRREVAMVRELVWVSHSDEVSIQFHQPELQSSELASAWHLIHDRFLCRPEQTALPITVKVFDLTIKSQTGDLTLRDIDAWIEPRTDAIEATVQCVPADSPDAIIDIKIRRDRSGDTAWTQWSLDTHNTPLPCSALAEFLPAIKRLGSDAKFVGTMSWKLGAKDWWIDLGGSRFEEVSLDRIFEQHTHRFDGQASIHLKRGRIDPLHQQSDIAGTIRVRNGVIGRQLLVSAREHLGFAVDDRALVETRDLPYDLIALSFNLNTTQLELAGACSGEDDYRNFPPNVVLCLDGIPLVQSSRTTIDAIQIANLLAPAHSVHVPISNQTRWLMNVLVPPSRPLPNESRYPPRIRAAGLPQGGPTIQQPRF